MGFRYLRGSPPALFEKVVQRLLNLFQVLVFPLIDDVPDVLAELHVILRLLKCETLNFLHVVIELIMLPQDIESCLRAAHGDAECGTVNRLNLIALVMS